MNILNTVMGALGGNSGGNPLMSIVMNMLSGNEQQGGTGGGLGSGLGGLLQQFQQNGLGDAAQSWIGSGQNLPISAEQLASVFGSDKIAEIAKQAGLSSHDVSGQLADMLPQAVDKLTPDGIVPEGNLDLGSIASVLGNVFSK